jgi:hypothetical protein
MRDLFGSPRASYQSSGNARSVSGVAMKKRNGVKIGRFFPNYSILGAVWHPVAAFPMAQV